MFFGPFFLYFGIGLGLGLLLVILAVIGVFVWFIGALIKDAVHSFRQGWQERRLKNAQSRT